MRRTSCACASRVPCEDYKVNPVLARALDRIFILHADHEQNASTSTVRLAGSSGANPFACIAAGIACLWGPAHGGANEAALKMLGEIGKVENIPEYIAARQGQERPVPADGLRPPRLQELRSARQDHAEDRARRARTSSASRTIRCSTWRWSSSASRCTTTISSRRSSIPTSTSIPASR